VTDPLRRPIEEIEALQSERLRELLALCARGHPYYKRTWLAAGLDVGKIRTVDDLEQLPLTFKHDLMVDPEGFRLDVPELPLHERTLWDVIYTTGSTSEPTPVYNTTHDYHAYLFQSRRVAEISGVRDTDVIANLFPLTPAPMGAFVRSAANAYASGAAIFAALPGAPHGSFGVQRSLDDAVRLTERHRATVLWGVPSFVRRVLLRAKELGADFSNVRMCVISGEAATPAMREELRRCMRSLPTQATTVFDRYGSTELGAFAQCIEDGDWHNPAPEIQFHEVVDPHSGRRLPDGERGMLAVTHLHRRGTVLVRFIVGDQVGLTRMPCPHCGRTSERVLGPVVRAKDLVKVKGMLINPTALVDALRAVPEIDEFQVVVQRCDPNDPFSMDEIVIRVSTAHSARDSLALRVATTTNEIVRVTPRVEFVQSSEIFDTAAQTKAVRFHDRR
jgi:phenylacetate-coenzyme A ligase PaaK-like adenylate-forming protein